MDQEIRARAAVREAGQLGYRVGAGEGAPDSGRAVGIDAKAVNDLIARNARVAQDQKEYNERYDALVSRYEETEHKRDAAMEQIDRIMIRRRRIERFIESLKDLPELYTEFDAGQWAALGDNGNP